ncbi:hypothetical protein NW837_01805 [Synechococcus sp. R6-10]
MADNLPNDTDTEVLGPLHCEAPGGGEQHWGGSWGIGSRRPASLTFAPA